MTPSELESLEALASKATPGTWYSDDSYVTDYPDGHGRDIALTSGKQAYENAAFIAASREAVPKLCAALRQAWAEREEQRQSAFFATANARTMQAERDARPDAATVAEVVELLHSIEDGPMSNAAAKLLVQALRLLEKP